MAHAHIDTYAKNATVKIECSGEIGIHCGNTQVVLRPDEAIALRDDLSRAITEAATAAAKAVEGAQA